VAAVCAAIPPQEQEMRTKHLAKNRAAGERGFSLVELLVVLAIILVVSAVAVPNIVTAMRGVRLRGTASDYSGVLQQARMRAVRDNRIYSVRIGNDGATTVAYIDIYPQNADGTSGQGAYSAGGCVGCPPRDPAIIPGSDVSVQPIGAAPAVLALQNQVIPAGSIAAGFTDGSVNTSNPTFNSRGLPCLPSAAIAPATCSSPATTPVAYVTFFMQQPTNAATPQWVAVTITPAGRVQTWTYDGANWGRL
jgi:prepilin-type N-terminal cleavage/methylation domain-containing protein